MNCITCRWIALWQILAALKVFNASMIIWWKWCLHISACKLQRSLPYTLFSLYEPHLVLKLQPWNFSHRHSCVLNHSYTCSSPSSIFSGWYRKCQIFNAVIALLIESKINSFFWGSMHSTIPLSVLDTQGCSFGT